jgi:hypothetical protein
MWIFSAIANAVGRNFIGRPNYLFDLLFNRVKADGGVTEAQQCTINELTDLQNDNLLSSASLVLTPSSYKEGKLYSIIPENGDGDFTFTRATTATRVNSDGLVELVPYNLFQYSEEFDNAYWTKLNISVTANATTSPDGSITADKLIGDNNNFLKSLYKVIGVSASTIYTGSVFVKAAEYTKFYFRSGSNTAAAATFDLTGNGSVIATFGSPISTSIIALSDGWYKVSLTHTTSSTNPDWAPNYVGYPNSGVWGAQLVEGTNALPYQKTETRLNIPRIDYSLGGCPNILLEPQRTNTLTYSSSFDNAAWTKVNATVTANTTTSPSGVVDADTLTADGTSNIHQTVSSAISFTNSTTYTYSVYVKKNTNNFIQLYFSASIGGMFANFDLNNGVVGTLGTITGTTPTSSITSVGNGWYRCSMTITANATTTAACVIHITSSSTAPRAESNTLSTSVFIWGAQVEAGSYATSYIPTTTASVTRNTDALTRNNIYTNGLITAAGGTWFVEIRGNVALTRDANVPNFLFISNNSSGGGLGANVLAIGNVGFTNSRMYIFKLINGAYTQLAATTTTTIKIAIKWNGTTADVFVNGVKVVSATAFTTTNMEFLNCFAADVPKYINQMALFPTPLTDEQCSIITSDSYPTAAAAYASLGLVSESPSCLTSTTTF